MAFIVVVVLAGVGVGMASVGAAQETGTETQAGEALTGVIGVTDAEIEGEIAERGFGIRVAQAASNESQAEIVAHRLADIEERLDTIEARQAELDAAREAGNISEGRYNAQMARLETERATAERLANQSADVSDNLPTAVLEEQGVSVAHIHQLRDRANNLTGPEVAAIAHQIAGPDAGASLPGNASDRGPTDPGPPDHAGPGDDRAEEATDGGARAGEPRSAGDDEKPGEEPDSAGEEESGQENRGDQKDKEDDARDTAGESAPPAEGQSGE